MRRAQEGGGFRRTGTSVGAASASGYHYSAADGTSYQGNGSDKRNVRVVGATGTPSSHHNNPGYAGPVSYSSSSTSSAAYRAPSPRTKTVIVTTTATTTARPQESMVPGKYCSKCGDRFQGNFCGRCGQAAPGVPERCPNPNCREHIARDARFCPSCGSRV